MLLKEIREIAATEFRRNRLKIPIKLFFRFEHQVFFAARRPEHDV